MATLQEIRNTIDTRLQTLWTTLVNRQTTYASNHGGKFFQGLITHATLPSEGDTSEANLLVNRPTDQAESWTDFGVPLWTEAFALRIDTYDGPLGRGWIATLYVTVNGKTYTRSRGVGPENRNQGWAELVNGFN